MVFGGVLHGFMKKTEDLTFNQEILWGTVVEESTLVLQSFKRIRKAFEPLLFLSFTCKTIFLTTMTYFFVSDLRKVGVTVEGISSLVMESGVFVLTAFMTLVYESFLADDAYAAMKTLLVPLG